MLRVPLSLLLIVASSAAPAAVCPFDAAVDRFEALIDTQALDGGALLVGDAQGIQLERYFGSYAPDTRVRIASATKLLSAVRIAQLAERGAIDLDAPVSDVLPQFTGLKGTMTVAQMFSHTAGYGGDAAAPITLVPTITLAQAVDTIACCVDFNPGWAPGAQFAYGGVSMHVAGRVAEVVGGGDWQTQWQQQIGVPLGVASIDYEAFNPTTNYGIGGSARSTLRDYGRVLQMLTRDGQGDGNRLLFDSTVRAIFTDRAAGLPVAAAPANAIAPIRYGLGNWLDASRNDADDAFAHSLGAFGFFPFVDRRDGIFGVFMIEGPAGINDVAFPIYLSMVDDIRTELGGAGCDPIERTVGIGADGFESAPVPLELD